MLFSQVFVIDEQYIQYDQHNLCFKFKMMAYMQVLLVILINT